MHRITLAPIGDLATVSRRWRALEEHADPGFFRSWTFLGCLAEERFEGAQLLSVTQDGDDMALALLGRAGGRLWLNQTGSSALDAPFIEHNGLLVRNGQADIAESVLRHLARRHTTVLSGIGDQTLQAAQDAGWLVLDHTRFAPCVTLGALTGPYLQTLSANARAQIRRSQRLYGPDLQLARAPTMEAALAWFDELVALHQAAWIGRGHPGAFADPAMRRFHRALITRAWPRGEADLLQIRAGLRTVGLLYDFVQAGRVLAYQSGFDYQPARPHEKPGLVCHALAIAHYAAAGAASYDLLAGAERYKTTLAHDGQNLHWATLHRPWSAGGVLARARAGARQIRAARRANGDHPAAPGR